MILATRRHRRALRFACFLSALSFLACRAETRASGQSVTTTPAGVLTGAAAIVAADVHRLPDVIRDLYRCHPDRRFLLAARYLRQLSAGADGPPIEARFDEGHWRILEGDREIGRVSEIPSYDELFAFVQGQAPRMTAIAKTADDRVPGVTMRDPNLERVVVQLAAIAVPCRSVGCDARAVRNAAQGLVWLSFMTVDTLQQADPLVARALALVALEKSLSLPDTSEEEVLLASAMGYEAAALDRARQLPAANEVRAYTDRDTAQLRKACGSGPAGLSACQFLLLALEAGNGELFPSGDEDSFAQDVRHLPSADSRALAALGLTVRLRAFSDGGRAGEELASRTLALVRGEDAGGRTATLSLLSPPSPPSQSAAAETRDFERAVAAAAQRMSGGPVDPVTIESWLRAMFLSGVFRSIDFLTAQYSSSAGAAEYAAGMANLAPGWATELKQWTEISSGLLGGSSDLRVVSAAVMHMKNIGPIPLLRFAHTLGRATVSTDPLRRRSIPAFFAMLDSRPVDLLIACRLATYNLWSPRLRERYAKAVAGAAPYLSADLITAAAMMDRDETKLRRLAEDPRSPRVTRLGALTALGKIGGPAVDQYRLSQYERAARSGSEPYAVGAAEDEADLLQERGDLIGAIAAIDQQLRRRSDRSDLVTSHLLTVKASLLAKSGKQSQAFLLLQQDQSGKEEVFEELADLAISLGKTEEAVSIARKGWDRYPDVPEFGALIVKARWRSRDYVGAAKDAVPLHTDYRWTGPLPDAFAEVFSGQPPDGAKAAFAELRRASVGPFVLGSLLIPLLKKGQIAIGLPLTEGLTDRRPDWDDGLKISLYQAIKEGSDEETATSWLQRAMPNPRDEVAISLYQGRHYELLWSLLPSPTHGNKARVVRLLKAAALLHLKEARSDRRDALVRELQADPDPNEDFVRFALFLLGQRDDGAVLRPLKEGGSDLTSQYTAAANAGWLMGIKAASEGRFEEAEPWLQVALEAVPIDQPLTTFASTILAGWLADGRGMWLLAAKGDF
jgi:tetratricopeptide (TPR) repeat protein